MSLKHTRFVCWKCHGPVIRKQSETIPIWRCQICETVYGDGKKPRRVDDMGKYRYLKPAS